jgi:hypothetical protein
VCLRGASAIDRLLAEFSGAPLRALVVWEPVLPTDFGPPLSSTLGLVRDPRAVQFWDPDRVLAADVLRSVNADPARYGFDEPLPPDFVVWDVVAVFAPSARWAADLPVPAYYGGPVTDVIDATREALAGYRAPRPAP